PPPFFTKCAPKRRVRERRDQGAAHSTKPDPWLQRFGAAARFGMGENGFGWPLRRRLTRHGGVPPFVGCALAPAAPHPTRAAPPRGPARVARAAWRSRPVAARIPGRGRPEPPPPHGP